MANMEHAQKCEKTKLFNVFNIQKKTKNKNKNKKNKTKNEKKNKKNQQHVDI
jgi:hypothetical protein